MLTPRQIVKQSLRALFTPRKKISPAEKARQTPLSLHDRNGKEHIVDLKGKTGEELITDLVMVYKWGHCTIVYEVLLDVELDADSFPDLQAKAWKIISCTSELQALSDNNERMVRAIALMANQG